jgi:hypothetical protein
MVYLTFLNSVVQWFKSSLVFLVKVESVEE